MIQIISPKERSQSTVNETCARGLYRLILYNRNKVYFFFGALSRLPLAGDSGLVCALLWKWCQSSKTAGWALALTAGGEAASLEGGGALAAAPVLGVAKWRVRTTWSASILRDYNQTERPTSFGLLRHLWEGARSKESLEDLNREQEQAFIHPSSSCPQLRSAPYRCS